jgi:hypothetical protein
MGTGLCRVTAVASLLVGWAIVIQPAVPQSIDTMADTWVATDSLGRQVPTNDQVGPPRKDKAVGVFYFLWLGQHGTNGPFDVTRILSLSPHAMARPDDPAWGPPHAYHHWGQPLFDYYLSDDAWVLRKHAQMLADADVDVIIFDVTNQVTYPKIYTQLCEVFTKARRDGNRTPQIAFLCPFWDSSKVVAELYRELYQPGRFRDLWFVWKGKPLILADPDKAPPETKDFFTFRSGQPDYFQGPTAPDQWGWLEVYPQHVFRNAAGQAEQMVVGVAQNSNGKRLCAFSEKNTLGRSWHDGAKDRRRDAVSLGLNFAEQWERALEVDPQFIFITSWNEWIAMRLPEFAGHREPVMFVDQYTEEYSRDIEPMKGGHDDNYYYQMISYIRRFKGVRPLPAPVSQAAISIDGRFDDWSGVTPEYRDDQGDVMHRDHPGYDNVGRLTNDTGRNDLVLLKTTHDDRMIYFYARTAAAITPAQGNDWMLLFIDADRKAATGWQGYDFVINRTPAGDGTARIETTRKGWNWRNAGDVTCRVSGNELELAIPRESLGLTRGRPEFYFKWADNAQLTGDPAAFLLNGDTAPNSRFSYASR